MPALQVSNRVKAIKPSATLTIDANAKAMIAAGQPVISFGAGEPDFPTPAFIVSAAAKALEDPKNHKYSATAGLPALRQAIALKTSRDSGFSVDPAQVVVTNGGKQALFETVQALINPGDEVLLPAPYWLSYPEVIALAGGVTVAVETSYESNFKVDVAALEAAWTPRTKALILNSPSNPTGSIYSSAELRAIGEWALAKGLWVISDEIYEHLAYDQPTAYILKEVPALAAHAVILNGLSKSFAMTGWRLGWLIAPPAVARGVAALQGHLTSNINNVTQTAALAALTNGTLDPSDAIKPDSLEASKQMLEAFRERRTIIVDLINAIDGFKCNLPDGAFYAFVDVSDFLQTHGLGSAAELADLILDRCEVAAVPMESFGVEGYLRFSYALSKEDIVEAFARIKSWADSL